MLILGHTDTVLTIIVDKDILYSASFDVFIKVWDITSGANVFDFVGNASDYVDLTIEGHTNAIYSLDVSSDYLVSGGFDNTVRAWDLTSRTWYKTWTSKITTMSISFNS